LNRRQILKNLSESRPRNFGIGQDIQPKRDLSRFLRWPKYIRLQRQKKILLQRLKIPPVIHQFSKTLDKNHAGQLFSLLKKYRPESRHQKMKKLRALAKEKSEGKVVKVPVEPHVHTGLKNITTLIEKKKAKLVVIAHDVDPIELVVWIPALCRKLKVPFCFVKSKSRLGQVVHLKKTACLALTKVNKTDENSLSQLARVCYANYNCNKELRRTWGGQKLGPKAIAAERKHQNALAKEKLSRKMAMEQNK